MKLEWFQMPSATHQMEELCSFIAENTGFGKVDPGCRIDQLVSDPLEHLIMLLDIQEEFEARIPRSKYGELKTVADIGAILFGIQAA